MPVKLFRWFVLILLLLTSSFALNIGRVHDQAAGAHGRDGFRHTRTDVGWGKGTAAARLRL